MPRYVFEHTSLDLITHLPVTARGHDSIFLPNAPTALDGFLATRDGLRVRTRVSLGGVVMSGFVVCLLLYAVLSLQDVFVCTVHVAHVYNVCGTDPQIRLGQ